MYAGLFSSEMKQALLFIGFTCIIYHFSPGKAPAALGTQLRVKVIPFAGAVGEEHLRCLSGRRLSVLFEALPEGGVCFGQRQLPPRREAED